MAKPGSQRSRPAAAALSVAAPAGDSLAVQPRPGARRGKGAGAPAGVLARVAAACGVSQGTVSRAFNQSPLISPRTRARVFAAAEALGVRPRVELRRRQIALVTTDPASAPMGGYVSSLTQYVCHALARADVNIALVTEDRLERLSDNRFDGVVGIAWRPEALAMLQSFVRTPVVWFSDDQREHFHTVYLDPVATGAMVGDYLCARGHRRVAVIHDPDYCGRGRADGVAVAVARAGGDPGHDVLRLSNDQQMPLLVKAALDAACTAIWVTGEDMKALEVSWTLQELAGKRVPQDVSLIGFENPKVSEFLRPSLTTVATPLREMAERAAEILLNPPAEGLRHVALTPTLIERASVATIC